MEPEKIFAVYKGYRGESPLADACLELLEAQKGAWPHLRAGYEALETSRVLDIGGLGYAVKVQWNPQRITSSAARIDAASIQARPCFLCAKNLPEAQRAVVYRNDYAILCNPAPIFSLHFTIAHLDHRPQAITSEIDTFLTLIQDFAPRFHVFYNGPQSGASAPDHLHFQAAPADAIPVEEDIRRIIQPRPTVIIDDADIFPVAGLGRAILIVGGSRKESVASALLRLIAAMGKACGIDTEPMMNILGFYEKNRWTILVFPRARHRPSVYDRPGDAQILITPGCVEMGGFFITPREKDFLALDAGIIEDIYRDVSVDDKQVRKILAAL